MALKLELAYGEVMPGGLVALGVIMSPEIDWPSRLHASPLQMDVRLRRQDGSVHYN